MALKLNIIQAPPQAPRGPAVTVETTPTDDASLIKLWRPQAAMRARKGESEFTIARFLHSKGVEGAAARAAAKEIIANPGETSANADILIRITGFLLFSIGLVIPVACLALGIGGIAAIAAMFAALIGVGTGCKLLWNARNNA